MKNKSLDAGVAAEIEIRLKINRNFQQTPSFPTRTIVHARTSSRPSPYSCRRPCPPSALPPRRRLCLALKLASTSHALNTFSYIMTDFAGFRFIWKQLSFPARDRGPTGLSPYYIGISRKKWDGSSLSHVLKNPSIVSHRTLFWLWFIKNSN